MIGVAAAAGFEQPVICVEHFSGKQLEPLSGHSSRIFSLFSSEFDLQLPSQLLNRAGEQALKGVLKDVLSSQADVDGLCFVLSAYPAQFGLEERVLVVEGEQVGRGRCDLDDGHVEDAGSPWVGCSFCELPLDVVVEVEFEVRVACALLPQFAQVESAEDKVFLVNHLAAPQLRQPDFA